MPRLSGPDATIDIRKLGFIGPIIGKIRVRVGLGLEFVLDNTYL
jgi:hypothetical protein